MFSANTEKGPVTPKMVRGWPEKLFSSTWDLDSDRQLTYTEKINPQSPVLNTTSIVPHDLPVRVYRSLANVIPGRMLVKKM